MGGSSRWLSRKFVLAVASFVAAVLVTAFGVEVDAEVVFGAMAVVLSFVGVEGWADVRSRDAGVALERALLQAQLGALRQQFEAAAGDVVVTPDSSVIGLEDV